MITAAHAQTAGTEAPGGPKAPFPPFNQETYGSQLIWLAITFVLLYFLLARVVLPRVATIFVARRERVEGDIDAAGRMRAESEAAITAYEHSLSEARSRAQAIASKTREEFAKAADERKRELESSLAGKLAEAERTIERTKSAAMANVKSIAADAASAIVERLIGERPQPPAVERAVDSLH